MSLFIYCTHDTLMLSTFSDRKAKQVEERAAGRAAMLKAELEVERERNIVERKRKVALQALVTECEVSNTWLEILVHCNEPCVLLRLSIICCVL